MSLEDKYTSFSTKSQEQFITSDNKILKVKAELELIKDEKGNFIVKKVTIPDSFNKQRNLIYFYGKGTNWNKIIKRGSLKNIITKVSKLTIKIIIFLYLLND